MNDTSIDYTPFIPLITRLPGRRVAMLLDLLQELAREVPEERSSEWMELRMAESPGFIEWLVRVATELDDVPFERFFRNFVMGVVVRGHRARLDFAEEHGFYGPATIVINPTMTCNLGCRGCYARCYPGGQMDYGLLRRVLVEARDLGARFITVSGGEPFSCPHVFRMAEEFDDLVFMTCTNGTLLDPVKIERMAHLGNVWPAIGVDGFREQTDSRRGKGVYDRVIAAMDNLRNAGVMFGFSVTVTRDNTDAVASDDFIDTYIDRGALFGWIYQFMPVGRDPDLDLMSTPEQREQMRRKTKEWQRSRPLVVGDFWNEGSCVGGCLSGSRSCTIFPDGTVQPCTFVHFSTHNVRDHSLVEVFGSDFFSRIRSMQPCDCNLLRSCKIIDHPDLLRAVVDRSRAVPVYEGADDLVRNPEIIKSLDAYARQWAAIADRAWNGPDYEAGRSVHVPILGRIDVRRAFPARMEQAKIVSAMRKAMGRGYSISREGKVVRTDPPGFLALRD